MNESDMKKIISVFPQFTPIYYRILEFKSQVNETKNRKLSLLNEIEELDKNKSELQGYIDSLEKSIEPLSSEIETEISTPPEFPTPNSKEWLLSIGLSIMLFIGFSELFGVDIIYPRASQLPLFLLAFISAMILNLAEFMAVQKVTFLTKNSFLHVLVVSSSIILFEVSFAYPGLVNLFPPSTSSQISIKIMLAMAASLAAFVNVLIAWGKGKEKLDYFILLSQWNKERKEESDAKENDAEYQKKKREIQEMRREVRQKQARLSNKIKFLENNIIEKNNTKNDLESIIKNYEESISKEIERWENEVNREIENSKRYHHPSYNMPFYIDDVDKAINSKINDLEHN